MYADLHIHSCFSDGILSPKQILDEVIKTSLKSIAITDHDNIKGYNVVTTKGSIHYLTKKEITENSKYLKF